MLRLLLLFLFGVVSVHSQCGPNSFINSLVDPTPECPGLEDCPLQCRFGLVKNSDGCDVCECQDYPCKEGECKFPVKVEDHEMSCDKVGDCDRRPQMKSGCKNVICQNKCLHGLRNDTNGCRICACKPSPCNGHRCGLKKMCIADEFSCSDPPCDSVPKCDDECPRVENCKEECLETGFKRNANGCMKCECKKNACDDVKCPKNQHCIPDRNFLVAYQCVCDDISSCDKECKYGFLRDSNGCETCQCLPDPCERVKCPGVLKCKPVQLNVCLKTPCPFKAKCVPQ